MLVASKIDICQKALAKISAAQITTLEEASLEARECRRFYPQVVANMLEGPHDWSFARQRVALATVENDREGEWVYAYALPSNCASPLRVIPDLDALGLAVPVPLPGEPYAETWVGQYLTNVGMPYVIDGTTLYTNVEKATLEYVINDVTGVVISNLCSFALILELAASLAVPVKKNLARERDLFGQAEVAWQRAIADDRNRQPETSDGYVPENLIARHTGVQ